MRGLTLTESAYSPTRRLPPHAHECAYFSLVVAGSYTERVGRTKRERPTLSVAFHPPGEEHSEAFHCSSAGTFSVELPEAWTMRLQEASLRLTEPHHWNGGQPRSIATRMYREFHRGDEASSLILEGLTLELAGEALRMTMPGSDSKPPRWLADVEEILRAEFRRVPSLSTLARSVGVHPVHLAKTFRRWHRCTCGEFVLSLRIQHTQERLLTSQDPLAEIALEAGFYDQSHFCRAFRRELGVSPGFFRAQHARANPVPSR